MDLKQAKLMTREFKQNGKIITPLLSDDWTYSFETYYNSEDKIKIYSQKNNLYVYISMDIQTFFSEFIYTKKLKIDGNRLIGSFGFNKYNLFLEDKFLEAQRLVEDLDLNEPIPNNELIEFGIYLDDKGEKFIYLGNLSFSMISIREDYTLGRAIINEEVNRNKKRYIVNYDNESISYNSVIQKTGKRKFLELIKVLTIKEKSEFIIKLTSSFSSSVFKEDSFNNLTISKSNEHIYSSNLVFYKNMYGFYSQEYSREIWKDLHSFYQIDFKRFSDDLLNNTVLRELEEYKISENNQLKESDVENMQKVYFYLDYK